MSIDFQRVNFEKFFGWVLASNTKKMKSSVYRQVRASLTECAFSKYSDGQLKHVGVFETGRDFIINKTQESVEMKSLLNMFKKNGDCKGFTLKNFHPDSKSNKGGWKKEDIVKTFDFILLVDTNKMSIGYSTWDNVYSCIDETSNDPKVFLAKSDYTMIVENIIPDEVNYNVDELFSSIEKYI
jgi:ethanolamine utilization protein EutQ (cupin superfamily)